MSGSLGLHAARRLKPVPLHGAEFCISTGVACPVLAAWTCMPPFPADLDPLMQSSGSWCWQYSTFQQAASRLQRCEGRLVSSALQQLLCCRPPRGVPGSFAETDCIWTCLSLLQGCRMAELVPEMPFPSFNAPPVAGVCCCRLPPARTCACEATPQPRGAQPGSLPPLLYHVSILPQAAWGLKRPPLKQQRGRREAFTIRHMHLYCSCLSLLQATPRLHGC